MNVFVEKTSVDSSVDSAASGSCHDQDEGLDEVYQVMDDILSGPESPDISAHRLSQENPFYGSVEDEITNGIQAKNSNLCFDLGDLAKPTGVLNSLTLHQSECSSRENAEVDPASDVKDLLSVCGQSEKLEGFCDEMKTETNKGTAPDWSVSQNDPNYQIAKDKPVTIEPENMIKWRKDRAKMIADRDAAEGKEKEELSDLGKTQFNMWEKNYQEVLTSTKGKNREANQAFLHVDSIEKEKIGFVDTAKPITQLGEGKASVWEYVAKLCDLRPNNRSIKSDVTRMRLLMLQLRNEKFARPKLIVHS